MKSVHKKAAGLTLALALVGGTALTIAVAPWDSGPLEVAVLREVNGDLEIERVKVQSQKEADLLIKQKLKEPDVVAASVPGEVSSMETDELVGKQWGYSRLDGEATSTVNRGAGVKVAVVDSGVDGTHPDLAANMLPGFDVIGDSNGQIDPNGHGTHVAGIIAAVKDNGIGVAGLAPDVQIIPVRALDETGYGDDAGIAEGVLWAADNGAQVINLSLGSMEKDPVLAAAVNSVISRGVTVVAASGNQGMEGNPVSYPAALPGVIAVSGTSYGDQKAMFSTSGDYVTVSAPGVSIMSTWPGGQYTYSSGTSMSTPFVAATAALVKSELGLSGQALTDRITSSAMDLGDPGWDPIFGHGIVDPYAAITDGVPRQTPPGGMPGLPDVNLPQLPELPGYTLPEQEPLPVAPGLERPTLPPMPPMQPGNIPDAPTMERPEMHIDSTIVVGKIKDDGSKIKFEATLKVKTIPLTKRDLVVLVDGKEVGTFPTDGFGVSKVEVKASSTSNVKVKFAGDRIGKPSEADVKIP